MGPVLADYFYIRWWPTRDLVTARRREAFRLNRQPGAALEPAFGPQILAFHGGNSSVILHMTDMTGLTPHSAHARRCLRSIVLFIIVIVGRQY